MPRDEELTDPWDTSSNDPFAVEETQEYLDLPTLPELPPAGGRGGLGGPSSSFAPSSGSSSASSGGSGFSMPSFSFGSSSSSPSSSRAPQEEKHFLSYERRGLWGQASYNIGYSYFGGLALGGAIGCVQGLRAAPNNRFRILLNSVLNGSSKLGSRTGNAAGVLALIYTVVERQLEDVEVDKTPGRINDLLGRDLFPRDRWDTLIPASAAFATGALFALPRAITMRSVEKQFVTLGKRVAVMGTFGAATVLGVAGLSLVGPLVFGHRSPFRFSSA